MKKMVQNKDSRQLDAVYVDATQDANKKDAGRMMGDVVFNMPWGKVTLFIDALGMSVVLKSVTKKDDDFSPEFILALLKENGIVHGIRGEALMDVASRLKSASKWQGEWVMASGTPAALAPFPKIPQLEKLGILDTNGRVWSVDGTGIDFQKIQTILKAEELDAIESPYPVAWVVQPGDAVVEFSKAIDGAGKDVFGNPVPVATDGRFVAGEGVVLEDHQLKARVWGLVIVDGKKIEVRPPIWISADKMKAFYLHFPSIVPDMPLLREWFIQALSQLGIDEEAVVPMLDDVIVKITSGEDVPFATVVAQGVEAIAGQDAQVIFEVDLTQKPGAIMPDGSIDLRERNLIHNVSAEALIACKIPAGKGQVGKNLFGDVLTTTDGQDVAFVAGDGTRLREASYKDQVVPAIYATMDGAVVFRAGNISVNPIFRISGDVDYETGNVAFEKDIFIVGSVKTGFEVRAGGNVTIGGSIESGASVRAKGNVTVGRGILGKTTRVVAMGELRAQFIQNAMVVVKGDLWCGRYIHNAQVRCGGLLKVPAGAGAKSGSVVGGMVCATKGIDVALVGSESVSGTIMSIQTDPEEQAKIEKLKNNLSVCDIQISKLTRSLGVASLNGEAIKKKMAVLSGKQREHYVEILKKLKEVSGIRQKSEGEHARLVLKATQSLKGSFIRVAKTIFARNVIRMGEKEIILSEDTMDVKFELAGNGIQIQSGKEGV